MFHIDGNKPVLDHLSNLPLLNWNRIEAAHSCSSQNDSSRGAIFNNIRVLCELIMKVVQMLYNYQTIYL